MSKHRFRKGECRICGDRSPACWVDFAHTLCGDCVDLQDDPALEREPAQHHSEPGHE